MTILALALLLGQDKAIEGAWKGVEGEMAGKKMPEPSIASLRLEIGDGTYVLAGAESPDKGTLAVDASKKPRTIDITGTEGPNKGRTILAIYALEGDTLRICYDLSGKRRPSEFKTAPNSKEFMVTYKRDKK